MPGRIVIFDDSCNLCRTAIGAARVTGRGDVTFLPASGEEAGRELTAHGLSPELARQSLLVLEKGRVRTRSDAVLGLLAALRVPRQLLRLLELVPAHVLDTAYELTARHRYRLFGRR